ncbi:MAG: hypothetical protein IPL65_04820 [Lewinellaceae bacterium]|nr:hypothetical protein [Lewinellaceae bacterium]
MAYTIHEIGDILGGRWLQKASPDNPVEQLLLDSRHLSHSTNGLFFAIRGVHHDGHQFLQEAYLQGVRNFVVDRNTEYPELPEANLLLVDDSLLALQNLAAAHRQSFSYPVVGITGSNGKTIVKEWLYQLLEPDYDAYRSPKSFNSQVGVPLSVWGMQDHHHVAIIEAGISRRGEMARLAAVIQPNIGIFTNLGQAHSEGFSSAAEKSRKK